MASVSLPRADYTDRFATTSKASTLPRPGRGRPFEPASATDAKAARLAPGAPLLQLGPLDDAERVAGWEVIENTDSRMVLTAASWHLTWTLVLPRSIHPAPGSPRA
jgi:hypothetical protein